MEIFIHCTLSYEAWTLIQDMSMIQYGYADRTKPEILG